MSSVIKEKLFQEARNSWMGDVKRKEVFWFVIGVLAGVGVYWNLLYGIAVAVAGAILYIGKKEAQNWCLVGILAGLLFQGLDVGDGAALVAIVFLSVLKRSGLWWASDAKEMLFVCVGTVLMTDAVFFIREFGWDSWAVVVVDGCLCAIMFMLCAGAVESLEKRKKGQAWAFEETGSVAALLAVLFLGCYSVEFLGVGLYGILVQCVLLVIGYGCGYSIGALCGVVCGVLPALLLNGDMVMAGIYGMMGILCGFGKGKGKGYSCGGLLVGNLLAMAVLNDFTQWLGWMVCWIMATGSLALYTDRRVVHKRSYPLWHEEKVLQKERAFRVLADSLADGVLWRDRNEELERIFLQIYTQVCTNCKEKDLCWKRSEPDIREEIARICDALEQGESVRMKGSFCRHEEGILIGLKGQLMLLRQRENYEKQWHMTKKALAENVYKMKDVVKEEKGTKEKLGEGFQMYLLQRGVNVHFVNIEKQGEHWRITVALNDCPGEECGTGICNLAREYTNREWMVEKEECEWAYDQRCRIRLRSKGDIFVWTDAVQMNADKEDVCGDIWEKWQIDEEQECIVLCDGMGKGRKAHGESRRVIELLRVLLPLIETKEALKFVNNWLLVRNDSAFIGLDLLVVDKLKMEWTLYKLNGAKSIWQRGKGMRFLEGESLPLGVLSEIEIDMKREKIEKGDRILLMSDGVGIGYEKEDCIGWEEKENIVEFLLNREENEDDKTLVEIVFKEIWEEENVLAKKEVG